MPAASKPRPALVPQRTAAGRAELSRRGPALNQRQRTVLFLVDGQRGVDEIVRLAGQAGAEAGCFDELVALGLVANGADAVETSVLPSSLALQGDSQWSSFGLEDGTRADRPFDEARALLLRAVRAESPITGALTLIKLKRATTREALAALLDEVELRLRKPHRQVIAAQTMRHVRHLLTLPAHSRPPVG